MSKNLEISTLLDFYGDLLTEKQRNVAELYYNEDLSLGEIAEHEGITRQGVRDSIKRGECYLLELEEKLHVAKNFRTTVTILEEIEQLANTIYKINMAHRYSNEITENVLKIKSNVHTYLEQNT